MSKATVPSVTEDRIVEEADELLWEIEPVIQREDHREARGMIESTISRLCEDATEDGYLEGVYEQRSRGRRRLAIAAGILLALLIAGVALAELSAWGPWITDRRTLVKQFRLNDGTPAVVIFLCPEQPLETGGVLELDPPTLEELESCEIRVTTSPEKLGEIVAWWHRPWLEGPQPKAVRE